MPSNVYIYCHLYQCRSIYGLPVLETDFLKGLIDPSDTLHPAASKAAAKVVDEGWVIASTALLELDLLLKSEGISQSDRINVFEALEADLENEVFLSFTPHILADAVKLQSLHGSQIRDFYFDSLHVATARSIDGVIVSSDTHFQKIPEVQWIDLREI